jgi:hypothetical protein
MSFNQIVQREPPVFVTQFPNQYASKILKQGEMTPDQLADMIENAKPTTEKDLLPWLKLAQFGKTVSPKSQKCLRWNGNVVAISGVEGDYDGERLAITKAAALLRVAGVAAVLYTSASHEPEKPHWRVLAFLSKPIKGTPKELDEERKRLLGIVNAILGGVLANESFTLSQAYYYGTVRGRRKIEVIRVPGACIDRLRNAPAPIYADGKTTKHEYPEKTREELRSPDLKTTAAQICSLPNTARDWNGWKNLGLAADGALGEDGFKPWDSWSAKSKWYDAEETKAKWKYLRGTSHSLGWEYIQDYAVKAGWTGKLIGGVAPLFDLKNHFESVADMLKRDVPPVEYLFDDLIARGATSILGGPPKGFKSTWMMWLSLVMVGAIKSDWEQFKRTSDEPLRVGYIDLEQADPLYIERLRDFNPNKGALKHLFRINAFPKFNSDGVWTR